MIFANELEKTSILYSVCFGLKIALMSETYLELQDSRKFKICFYRVNKFNSTSLLVLHNKQKDIVQY